MDTPNPTIHTQGHQRNSVLMGRELCKDLDDECMQALRTAAKENATLLHAFVNRPPRPQSGDASVNGKEEIKRLPVDSPDRTFPALENTAREVLGARGIVMDSQQIAALASYLMFGALSEAQSGQVR